MIKPVHILTLLSVIGAPFVSMIAFSFDPVIGVIGAIISVLGVAFMAIVSARTAATDDHKEWSQSVESRHRK